MKGGLIEVEASASLIAEITDEKKQSEIGLYFIVLGGLRYTHTELLEIFGRTNMITYEHVKESSVLRYLTREARKEGRTKGLAEGRAEGRAEVAANLLKVAAQQRFPRLDLGDQLKQIHDADALQSLFIELNSLKPAKAFLQRLAELAATQPPTHKRAKKNGTSKK